MKRAPPEGRPVIDRPGVSLASHTQLTGTVIHNLTGVRGGRVGSEGVMTCGKVNVVGIPCPYIGGGGGEGLGHVHIVAPAELLEYDWVSAVQRSIVGTVIVCRTCRSSRSRVPEFRCRRGRPCLLPLGEEHRDGDSSEDTDDYDHDQQLDEGESSFVPLLLVKLGEPLAEKVKHILSFSLGCVRSASTYR